jgi:alpha-tubulin suppressor-like RCC1 family protein
MNRAFAIVLAGICVHGCTLPQEEGDEENTGVTSAALKPGPGAPSPWDVPATKVRAHGMHACAISPSNQLVCWGSNAYGELGRGYADNLAHPYAGAASVAPSPVLDTGFGSDYATFILRPADGLVQGWGNNAGSKFGALPLGTYVTAQTIPGIAGAREVAWGRYNACALVDATKSVWCWGASWSGNLGDGMNGSANVTTPKPASLPWDVDQISGAEASFCALRAFSSEVWCWGGSFYSSTDGSNRWEPRRVMLLPNEPLRSLSVGDGEGCVVTAANNEVWCWRGSPQAASFFAAGKSPLATGTRATKVTTSGNHRCAVLTDQTARCWGANQFGELGNGVTTTQLPPVTVSGLGGITDISASRYTTCAVAGGLAYCWGRNDLGQAGMGSTTSTARTTPAKVQFPQLALP